MKAVHRAFINKKLIPFILRKGGRGFLMERTLIQDLPGTPFYGDGIERRIPDCGTAACIKGSISVLIKTPYASVVDCAKVLGITTEQAHGLFYSWGPGEPETDYRWPSKYATSFKQAKTTAGKARVAVNLLKEVIRTNGDCLNPKETA